MSKSSRVFVLETEIALSNEGVDSIRKNWERHTSQSEIEGASLLILPYGFKLSELTGEGLPKVTVDSEGKLAFLEDKSNG